jgi:hypothetical protein
MELLYCSKQNVTTSCIISYIEGKYVQRVKKCSSVGVYSYVCLYRKLAK